MIDKIFVHPSVIKNMKDNNIPIPENYVVQEKLPKMTDKPLNIPDFLRDAINLSNERELLLKNKHSCPKCYTYQVQIIDVGNQEWKCRHCKHVFNTDYDLINYKDGI